eukprot:scaffold1172_cov180-Ochromonas_danica.AAC.2
MKEDRCREYFEANAHLFRKSRNPCLGELTARDDADFLIPLEQTLKKVNDQEVYNEYQRTKATSFQDSVKALHSYPNRVVKPQEMARLHTLRNQRTLIDEELKQLTLVRDMDNLNIFTRPF